MPEPSFEHGKAKPAQPPDQAERSRALDPTRSFLVQAPAGSGKTYLLTQRFLRLLAQAEKPDEIVAITFTNAAAAEMQKRVLDALEKAKDAPSAEDADAESLPALAKKAMEQAHRLGWKILDQPGQLRITTIDAFCRGLALQSPLSWGLLSGLGGKLDAVENARDLYRRAAQRALALLAGTDSPMRRSIEAVLLWRDNNWKDVEELLVEMLGQRNRWYQEFVFARNNDWEALRRRLEAPFHRATRQKLNTLCRMLDRLPGSCDHALRLARLACETIGKSSPLSLAERAELPPSIADSIEAAWLEDAVSAYRDLANFLLIGGGTWRKRLTATEGFPATPSGRALKVQMTEFLDALAQEPGLEAALGAFQKPMPIGYTEEEWELMQHCFAVLRVAFVELQAVFAETGSVDFVEVAQIALRILEPQNGFPSDLAMRQADAIRHLLIDEFQDTSRNQHQLLARLIAAWPEREGRTCFCVGDPMQSIYGFREAEVELFERTRTHGLDISDGLDTTPFKFDFVPLRANFRTAPSLIADLNGHFQRVFAEDDGSGIRFTPVEAARIPESPQEPEAKTELHVAFTRSTRVSVANSVSAGDPQETRSVQLDEIVALIRNKLPLIVEAQRSGAGKLRVAVLGRTKKSLVLIAEALREADIGFRAIELVKLRERPEVLDVLSLMRALLNPVDRTAWLGVLRAPWCGLSLDELHRITSADETVVEATPIPVLLEERLAALHAEKQIGTRAFVAASRVCRVLRLAAKTRGTAAGSALGTWIESVWKALGGEATVDAEQKQNLHLLWSALDALPEGELDLAGPGLDAALEELYALPNPSSSADFGVQLMTIHKSKGLEFEIVIVPDLDVEGRKGERTMISWLERGLAEPDATENETEYEQLTEFLIAPIQSKGEDPGVAKKWVDGVKREREKQELRRLLYVAATRARDELHLFARPRFSVSQSKDTHGTLVLAKPAGLLATAWPALGDAIEERFSAWTRELEEKHASTERTIETLAAQAGSVVEMPAPALPTRLKRLPESFTAPEFPRLNAQTPGHGSTAATDDEDSGQVYLRTEGGLRSRLEGTAIHLLLERLSLLRQSMSTDEAARAIEEALPGIIAAIRQRGLPLREAQRLVREALTIARQTLAHPVGAWILTSHPEAAAESRWTGMNAARERHRNLRPDRVFFAPHMAASDTSAEAEPVWWIIDYKTSQGKGTNLLEETERLAFLATHREQHIDQLAAYAQMLRSLRGGIEAGAELKIHAGIYYPRLQLFDFWEA